MKYLNNKRAYEQRVYELRLFFEKAADIVETLKYIIEDDFKINIHYYGNYSESSFDYGKFNIILTGSIKYNNFRESEEYLEFVDRLNEEFGEKYLVNTSHNAITRQGMDGIGNVKIQVRKRLKHEMIKNEMVEFGYGYEIKKKEEELLNEIKEYFCDLTDNGFEVSSYNHGINFITLQKMADNEWDGARIIGFDLNLYKTIQPNQFDNIVEHIEDLETSVNRLQDDGYEFQHLSLKFLYRWGGMSNKTLIDEDRIGHNVILRKSLFKNQRLNINWDKIIDSIDINDLKEESIPFQIMIKTSINKSI